MVYLFSLLVLILIKCDVTKQDNFLLLWLNHLNLLSKIIGYYHSNRKYPKINLHLLLALILKKIQHHKKDMSCFVTFSCKTKGSGFSYFNRVCNALYKLVPLKLWMGKHFRLWNIIKKPCLHRKCVCLVLLPKTEIMLVFIFFQ